MILEEITLEEFTVLEQPWARHTPQDRTKTYASFSNPLMAETYGELVKRFKDHPFGRRLNVRDGKCWHHVPREEITPDLRYRIESIASGDNLQMNHFEMLFRSPYDSTVKDEATIKFGRKGNLIIGYKTYFHRSHSLLFNCQLVYPQLFVEGIWDPRTME